MIPFASLDVSQMLSTDRRLQKSQLKRKLLLLSLLCVGITPFFKAMGPENLIFAGLGQLQMKTLSWSPDLVPGVSPESVPIPFPVPLPACQLFIHFSLFLFLSLPSLPLSMSLSLFSCLACEDFSNTIWWSCFILLDKGDLIVSH